jgi:MoaA/NifB/PqqE/SkfB family radical SAM enzyme
MHINQIRGVFSLVEHHPKVLSLAYSNIHNRVKHRMLSREYDGWSGAPEQITIMTTDQCNLRCKMCHYAHSDEPDYQLNQIGMMPAELFYKLIDEIPGNPFISFTGGEPLLHPQVAELIRYAKDHARFCSLTTNGWLLGKRANELCEAKLDLLVVSVDGPLEIHNSIRGRGSFEHIDKGIQKVLSLSDRPILFINMSLSNINYDQMENMYEIAINWKVDGINFNHLWYQTPKMIELSNEQFPFFEADRISWEIEPNRVDTTKVADSLEAIWKRSRFAPIIVNQIPDLDHLEIASWYHEPEKKSNMRQREC